MAPLTSTPVRTLLSLVLITGTSPIVSAVPSDPAIAPRTGSLHRRYGAGNGTTDDPYESYVSEYVDSLSEELWPINTEIHSNPEIGYEEVLAHELLTTYMESKDGWKVMKSAYGLDTAFVAEYDTGKEGPVVSFNAEYDALAGIGHGCGHNLIAMASVAGSLATAETMKANSIPGKVVLFGTPAEETFGGKIALLDAGLPGL